MIRIQRQRTKGWRMPEGAVYVGRPTLFGNPWTVADARDNGIPPDERAAWCVRQYLAELEHGGLMSDWSAFVGDSRWEAVDAVFDAVSPPERDDFGGIKIRSVRPLFRHLLRDAQAVACWCPLDQPCHGDVLIEILA